MRDVGLSTLLDLHQQVIDQEDGYWVKIEAWQVVASEAIPHGIRSHSHCTTLVVIEFWGMTMLIRSNISLNIREEEFHMTINIAIN